MFSGGQTSRPTASPSPAVQARVSILENVTPNEQRHCVSPHGFAPSHRVHALAGLGFHADLAAVQSQGLSQFLLHAGDMSGELGTFEANGCVNVHNRVTGVSQEIANLTEENEAGNATPFGRSVGKVPADIAQRGGA